jgi:hypothetical protein
VRARTLIRAALMMGGCLAAACSKPASDNGQKTKPNPAPGTRDIGLIEAPTPDLPLVSALEAGQPLNPTLVRRAVQKKAEPRTAPKAVATAASHADVVAAPPVLTLSKTSLSTAAAPVLALAPAPAAVVPAQAAPVFGDGRSWRSANHEEQPDGRDRGPGIIIRGARGGTDDHCDLHGRGRPVAVNQVAPPVGGDGLINDRFPRLGNGGRVGMPSSFPRGGIR